MENKMIRCNCCGQELLSGSLKYVVELKSFADFDGYLEEFEGDIEEGIECLLDAMEHSDVRTMEEDVSKELVYILCKRCRDKLMNDPFQTGIASFEADYVKGTVH